MDWGQEAARRLTHLSNTASDPGEGVTRLPFTNAHRRATDTITEWMNAAGLNVHLDAAGTLVGRREGPPGARTVLIGSHQDSVPGGGAYDGIMGIVLGCLALESLRDIPLDVSVEVLAFADEEGVRFPTALMGPRALAGTFDEAALEMRDADGIVLRDALKSFGGNPDKLPAVARSSDTIAGYFELHIEQGPVLEELDRPVGIVTAICGIERHEVRFRGTTGHAGTVPMPGRQDALIAASTFIAAIPEAMQDFSGLRATIGTMQVKPGAPNAIPDDVCLTLEVRSATDADRSDAVEALRALALRSADQADCRLEVIQTYEQPAMRCDPALSAILRASAGLDVPELPSGATHDASAMADLCPVAMLFVRCRDGVSHRPDEYASPKDMREAIDVLRTGLLSFDC